MVAVRPAAGPAYRRVLPGAPEEFLAGGACCLLENRPRAVLDVLTRAERSVLALVLQGLSNKEIASALGKAESTIKNQLAAVMRKCGVQSRCQLIVRLLRG